jgi:hypothetical protein
MSLLLASPVSPLRLPFTDCEFEVTVREGGLVVNALLFKYEEENQGLLQP